MATSTVPRRGTVHPRQHPPQPTSVGRPLRAVLDLGAVPTAPGCARAWTRQILWEWRLNDLSEAAEGVVSELITNSMLASRQQLASPVIVLILTFNETSWPSWCVTSAPAPRSPGTPARATKAGVACCWSSP